MGTRAQRDDLADHPDRRLEQQLSSMYSDGAVPAEDLPVGLRATNDEKNSHDGEPAADSDAEDGDRPRE